MVASHSSVPPHFWGPTARTLGALFAGSAVMFATTALNGGPPLLASGEVGPLTEPAASPTGTGQGASVTSPPAPDLGPGQAAEWTPGATPHWGSSLGDLPVRRAPVQETPWHAAPARPATTEIAAVGPATSGRSAAGPAAPDRAVGGARGRNAESGKPAPQTANPRQAGPVEGLLGSVFDVFDVANRLSR